MERLELQEPGHAMSDVNWDTYAGPVSACHCHSDTPAGAGNALTTHDASSERSTHPLPASPTRSGFPMKSRDAGTPNDTISSNAVPGAFGQPYTAD